jgi:hypothetical protein
VIFFGVVDGVAGNLDHHILLGQKCLAAQALVGLQTPGAVEQVFFSFFRLIQAAKTLAHDHVTGGASAAHVAGVLDVDVVVEQGLADAGARRRCDFCASRTVFRMRQYFDDGHIV